MRKEWYELSEEEKQAIYNKRLECDSCKKELGKKFGDIRFMRGLVRAKACHDCAESHFESVKAKYFVEEYKGNKFYKLEDKYYPYWEASYYFDSVEGCRERTDTGAVAVVDMNNFHSEDLSPKALDEANEIIAELQRQMLLREIDKALDKGDQKLFMELWEQL